MIRFPNAKINLGLHVVSKRADGYHNIETVFYPVPLCDALEVTPADSFSFHLSGISIGGNQKDNLVIKALDALQKEVPFSTAFNLHLTKKIPSGAGLGGGSSDAAATLNIINDYHKLGLSSGNLKVIAAKIGADCPFFIDNKPVFATGIGNVFQPIQFSLKGTHIVIVKPDVFVSTKEAYSMIQPMPSRKMLSEVLQLPKEQWKDELLNDFEKSVFALYPEIAAIKAQLYDVGALYACMSGSGSSVYGLFDKSVNVAEVFKDYYVWQGVLQ